MAFKLIRNQGNVPFLEKEGILVHPIDIQRKKEWFEGLKPYERMHVHHTLTSVRRYAHFHPFPGLIPTNSLDLTLSSTYDHGYDHFPDPVDTILQPETLGITTWRRLRNTKDVLPGEDPRILGLKKTLGEECETSRSYETDRKFGKKQALKKDFKYDKSHPVIIGGIQERKHPSYVKLMNSSHHAPQTNAGYSRQTGDGNVFVY